MTVSYEILRYRPEFRDRVLRLQTHLWSPDVSRNEAYLKWKHEENPFGRGPLIFLALHGREVVGMRSFFATQWQVGTPAETFGALYADDFVIAPEHRNQGLVSRIMSAAFRELEEEPEKYAINLSAGGVTVLASLAAGWRSVGPMEPVGRRSWRVAALGPVRRWLRSWPLADRGARSFAGAAAIRAPFSRIDLAISRRGGRLGPHVTVERAPRCEAMADLVARLPFDGRIRHVRDSRYFSWRYGNPLRAYRFLYREGERLEGYLVLQVPLAGPKGNGRMHIVDWEARDERVRADLLQAVLACGGFGELVTWAATSAPETRRLLRDSRFAPVDPETTARGFPCVLVRPIREEQLQEDWVISGRRLLDIASWDLRMIDSMHG